jgi:murein DD-endopeptidase MepM/ murein hydrolase activator NlpD
MPQVSDEQRRTGPRAGSTRARWLFAMVMFMVGIVPVCQIAKAVAPKPACPGATYSVVSGDSWFRIAIRVNVTMTALLTANAATTATVIHPGQALCLPSGVAAAPTATATTTTTTVPTPAAQPTTAGGTGAISVFPVQGLCSFSDTYGAPRGGARFHEGVDIIANAGRWIYAVRDGILSKQYLNAPGSLSGNGWRLTVTDGTYYFYAHLSAFAPGLKVGSAVKAGQIIGQVGMTGNAPIPHLHFEVHPSGGASINPTPVVKAVDGCKTTAVPPQPGAIPAATPATTVPATTVPVATVPATTTTTTMPKAHRRDMDDLPKTPERPRR